MKTSGIVIVLTLAFYSSIGQTQKTTEINMADSTGLAGDHFSLEAALATFKESKSLEDFEKKINSKDNVVNNLDLNGDGKVDYLRVLTEKKGDANVVILQVPISKTENQDVAVIEIEKNGENSALLQIIGDADLYGEEKIVEPSDDTEPSDGGVNNKGPAAYSYIRPQIFVNVWFWPCVSFMYVPTYVVYVSPWHWGYWPGWWSPWHPYPYSYYHMHNYHYHHYYHHTYNYRTTYAHQVYAPRRTTSITVNNRYRDAQVRYQKSRPATRPNQPAGRPSQPGVRPQQPDTRPKTKPQTRPDQPQTKPAPRPQQPDSRPQTKPQTHHQQPQSRPKTQSQPRPQQPPQSQTARPHNTPKSGGNRK